MERVLESLRRLSTSTLELSIVQIGYWKRTVATSQKRNANRYCGWGQARATCCSSAARVGYSSTASNASSTPNVSRPPSASDRAASTSPSACGERASADSRVSPWRSIKVAKSAARETQPAAAPTLTPQKQRSVTLTETDLSATPRSRSPSTSPSARRVDRGPRSAHLAIVLPENLPISHVPRAVFDASMLTSMLLRCSTAISNREITGTPKSKCAS